MGMRLVCGLRDYVSGHEESMRLVLRNNCVHNVLARY